jgi:hypothetical protein
MTVLCLRREELIDDEREVLHRRTVDDQVINIVVLREDHPVVHHLDSESLQKLGDLSAEYILLDHLESFFIEVQDLLEVVRDDEGMVEIVQGRFEVEFENKFLEEKLAHEFVVGDDANERTAFVDHRMRTLFVTGD